MFLDIFTFLIVFIPLFIFSFGLFDIFAPNILNRHRYSNYVVIAICFVSTFIILEMSKWVDIDTCRNDLQEKFGTMAICHDESCRTREILSISFKNIEINSCKDDSNLGSDVLYAEITGNQIFFSKLLNFYYFYPHKSKVYYPTDFSIHPKLVSDDLDLVYEDWENYKGDGSGLQKIIGCHSETFNCSFYYMSMDGTPF